MEELSPEEIENIAAVAESFQDWMNKEAKAGRLTGAALPEIIGILWVHMRQHVTIDVATAFIRDIVNTVEHRIQNGHIQLVLKDGTHLDFIDAEGYIGKEELRDMLIEASRDSGDLDQELRDLLGE